MRQIKEYIIYDNTSTMQTVYMTAGAEVLSAIEENGTITLCALVESTVVNSELRAFEVHSAGDLFVAEQAKHIATYKSAFGIRHLFELLK